MCHLHITHMLSLLNLTQHTCPLQMYNVKIQLGSSLSNLLTIASKLEYQHISLRPPSTLRAVVLSCPFVLSLPFDYFLVSEYLSNLDVFSILPPRHSFCLLYAVYIFSYLIFHHLPSDYMLLFNRIVEAADNEVPVCSTEYIRIHF